MGGFIAASKTIIDLLRQRARPYLFSNSLAPSVVAGTLAAIDIAERSDHLRAKLAGHTSRFRSAMTEAGFEILPGETPIAPVMLHDARLSQEMAREMDKEGVYVAGFFFPVVPHGKARIRTQMSAGLSSDDLEQAIAAFIRVGKKIGAIA
jgi:glycine C-acetyltransferase